MYWLSAVVSMICLAWLVRADTVKLKDGTVLEGTITEEDAISVTIQVESANGAVTEKRWALKSGTTEIHRTTAEEKAARAMELAFATIQKLQLDPTNSFQLEYYDRTLTNVFRKFVADYPDSPHTKEVGNKIAEWEAERALVASGKVKVGGQWLSVAEVTARAARDAAEQAYQQGRVFLRQKRSGEAVERFEFVIEKSDDTALVKQARELRIDAYQQWVTVLGQQRKWLANEMKRLEQRVTDARNAKTQAEAKLNAQTPGGGGGIYRGGDIRARARALGVPRDVGAGEATRLETDANRAQAFAAASRARLELQTAETELAEAQRNGKATDDTLARIQPQVAVLGITLAPSAEAVATQVVATAAPQAATSTEPEDMVTGIGQFAATYWIYFLAVAVILIWFFSRALGR
jgi:hypothetical protein